MASMTIEELEARQTEIRGRLQEIDAEYRGQGLPDESRAEWNNLNEELDRNVELIGELRARLERIQELAGNDSNVERAQSARSDRTRRTTRRIPDNPFDMAEYRSRAASLDELPALYREGALEVLEQAVFPHERAEPEQVRTHIERLLNTADLKTGDLAMRMLITGSPLYHRAFGKYLLGQERTPEEQRALSLTTTAGGFAVPYQLDPTIIPTSNGVVNPLRAISRVETITSNEWRGISSAGVTASYGAEGSEAADNAPTLAQPTANPEKAVVNIPFSIEIGQDWGSLQTEMAGLIQDAKDDLEATKFVAGVGHASNEPQGLLVGATAVVSTAAATTLAVGDLYSLEEALPPRFRPRAAIIGSRNWFNRVRRLDTTGGSTLWVRLGQGLPPELIGYPAYEQSAYSTALTTGASVMTIGDFSKFLIVDRVGLNIELIPHLFHTSNNRPSGQRSLYAYWRNTSAVLAWQAFRTLKVT